MSENVKTVIQAIPVEHIATSPYQARREFDEHRLKSLANSMRQEGLMQPITVRLVPGTGPVSRYELIAGERRLRAAKLLGWEKIDARVIETVSEAEAVAKGLVENLQREDLNAIEEAEGLSALHRLDPEYWTQAKIAEVTGISKSHVSELIRFLGFSDQIKEKFRQRKLTREHGAEILRLPTQTLQENVAERAAEGLTVKQTREVVNGIIDRYATLEKQEQGKATRRRGRSIKDPLASIWPSLLFSRTIEAIGAWVVSYKHEHWNFSVSREALPTREALASWFRQMAAALESAGRVPVEADTLPAAPVRLPKTADEERELENLAMGPNGPGAVYNWLYGESSPMALLMQDLEWSVLGVKDAKHALQEVLSSLRQHHRI